MDIVLVSSLLIVALCFRLGSMKVLNGLAFVITLGVAILAWLLYTFEPSLLLGTPWGSLHIAFALVAAFVLGALVVGVYVLTGWAGYQSSSRRRERELRQTKSDLETLRNQQPEVKVTITPDS